VKAPGIFEVPLGALPCACGSGVSQPLDFWRGSEGGKKSVCARAEPVSPGANLDTRIMSY